MPLESFDDVVPFRGQFCQCKALYPLVLLGDDPLAALCPPVRLELHLVHRFYGIPVEIVGYTTMMEGSLIYENR